MKIKLELVAWILLLIVACDVNDNESNIGSVYIESTPAGAQIFLDDVYTNKVTPATIEAEADLHSIKLKLEGYAEVEIELEFIAGEKINYPESIILKKMGYLLIESNPSNALIWLDGINTEKYTPNIFETDPGNHTITLQLENYQNTTIITRVESSDTTKEYIELNPR